MAINTHTVNLIEHERFISEHRRDPFTKDLIRAGDTIVFCAGCKSAFLHDSWQLMQGRHCNQQDTLREFLDLESIETEFNRRNANTYQEVYLSNEDYLEQMQNQQNQTEEDREIEDLILYIKHAYPDLKLEENKPALIKLLDNLRDYLIANPEEYYGKAVITQDLIQQSKVASRTVTVSNFINFIFSAPLLYYAFGFLGNGFAIVTTIVSGLGLQAFSNSTAAAVAGRTANNKKMPILAAASMLLVNGVLTAGSGVGSELLLNGTGLAEQHAKELADEYVQGKEEAASDESSDYYSESIALEEKCKAEETKLENAGDNNPKARRIYSKIYGEYKYKDNRGIKFPSSASKEKIDGYPLCLKADGYRDLVERDVEQKRDIFESLENTRNNLGNDIEFLEENAENIHQNNFRNDGELKNGSLAVEIALSSLWEKTFSGNFKQLGFPLFLFLISLVTSLTACAFVFCLSLRKDSLESHSDVALREIDNWMYEKWIQLRNKQRKDLLESNRQNLRHNPNEEEQKSIIYFKNLIKSKGLNNDINSLASATRTALWIEKEYQKKHEDKIYLLQSQGISLKKLISNNTNENDDNTFDVNMFKENVENLLGVSRRANQDPSNNNHR